MAFYWETKDAISQMLRYIVVGGSKPHREFVAVGNIDDQKNYEPIMIFLKTSMPYTGFFYQRGTTADPIDRIGMNVNAEQRILFSVKDIREFLDRSRHLDLFTCIVGIAGKFCSTTGAEPPVTRYVLFRGFDFTELELWLSMNGYMR